MTTSGTAVNCTAAVSCLTTLTPASNVTDLEDLEDLLPNKHIKLASDIVLTSIVIIVMLALGATLDYRAVILHLRRPTAIALGALCQFVILPLCAFGLAHALQLQPNVAIAVMIMASCPGGVMSNVFSFLAAGDVSLSICMTTCSTVAAMGMMPLNLFLYTRHWTDATNIKIPFDAIAISLVTIIVPVSIGMWLKEKKPKVANVVTKMGAVGTAVAIIGSFVLQQFLYKNSVLDAPWQVWLIALIMPLTGFTLGFALPSLLRFSYPVRRTMAIEIACQNTVLAIGIVSLTFPPRVVGDMMPFLLLFGAFFSVESCILLVVVRVLAWWSNPKRTAQIGNGGTDAGEIKTSIEPSEKPPTTTMEPNNGLVPIVTISSRASACAASHAADEDDGQGHHRNDVTDIN